MDVLANLGRDLAQVFFVLQRHDNIVDTGVISCQNLLAQPADGQHTSTQGNLTGHSSAWPHRSSSDGRDQGCRDSDASGRTIFRQRVLWHVNMQVHRFLEVRVDLQFSGTRANVGERGNGGFAHDVAQLSRDDQLTFSYHCRDFYRQQDAA